MVLLSAGLLSSCGEYNNVLKSTDYEYKYEAAKAYFAKGQNSKAATVLEELIPIMKGTRFGEESLYMLAMTYFNQGDYVTASHYFNTYYTTYPRGTYTELARFNSGKALYLDTPEPRLDQSSTYKAIQELQMYMEYFNYLAAVVTAQNILKEYPYTKLREDLSILILRAKYDMARESVLEKKEDRMRETIDEYYAFKNEFPESKYMKEVENIFKEASKFVGSVEEEY